MRTILVFLFLALPMVAQVWGTARRVVTGEAAPSNANCTNIGHVGNVYVWKNAQGNGQTLYVCAQTGVGVFQWEATGGAGGASAPAANGLQGWNGAAWAARSIALGTRGGLTVTNGNGVSGNPTIDTDSAAVTLFSTSTGLPSALSDFATTGAGERLHLRTDTGQAWLSFANSDFRQLILAGSNGAMNVPSNAGDVSAPSNGQVWYDSTAGKFRARENGATVDLRSGGGTSYTAPPTADWSWEDQGSCSLTSSSSSQIIDCADSTSDVAARMRSVAAGDFTLTAVISCDLPVATSVCYVYADNGAGTRRTLWELGVVQTTGVEGEVTGNPYPRSRLVYNNAGSDTAVTNTARLWWAGTLVWVRLARSGSTLTWSYSLDAGNSWVTAGSDTETNWLGTAVTRLGFGVYRSSAVNSALKTSVTLLHWVVQ